MEARYLLVRGVQGKLVANPHTPPETRRMLGKRPNGIFWEAGPIDPETGQPRWPAAVACEEVVLDDQSIRKAANGSRGDLTSPSARGPAPVGDIVIVAECRASSCEEAERKFAAMKKADEPKSAPVKSARPEK